MKRKLTTSILATGLLISLVAFGSHDNPLVPHITPVVTAQTVTQCGTWLANCAAQANADYLACRQTGGTEDECAAEAEELLDACIEGLYNAGCSTFPAKCYTFDVRIALSKECNKP